MVASIVPVSVLGFAIWGLLGAFNYAAPKLTLCYHTARENKAPWGHCLAEFPIALATGAISAAAFSSYVGGLLHVADSRAIAAVIGMIANTVTPALIAFLTDKAKKWLNL